MLSRCLVCFTHQVRLNRYGSLGVRLFSSPKKKGGGHKGSSNQSSSGGGPSGGARGGGPSGGSSAPGTSSGSAGSGASPSHSAPPPVNEGRMVMSLRDVEKRLPGGRVLFKGVNLAFSQGAKIGVLGLNGAGKSSLLKILAGVDGEFDGVCWREEGLRVGYLAQEPTLDEGKSVHENIMEGLREKTALLARFEELSAAMGEEGADIDALLVEQAEAQGRIEDAGCWNLGHVVAQAKGALRVPPDDAPVASLSGGERRRVALCRLLLEAPGVLLLDEPTNHLDATSVAWLERYLGAYKGTVLAVTHDRYFLDNVAGWILEVDGGRAMPYAGNYSVWLERKATRGEGEARAERKKGKAMEEELAWIRQGPKARQSKSKARIARYEEAVEAAREERGREKLLSGAMVIPPGPRLGALVLEVEGLSKTLPPSPGTGGSGEGKVLFKDVTFALPRGGIVGIIGPNGAGKTSLLRCIMGDEGYAADAGAIRFGQTVKVGLVSQSRAELEPNVRVLEAVCGGMDTVEYGPGVEMPARQYLACFNLVGEQQTKLVRSLSGGERNRVHLARTLRTGVNLLMLDEPTNDLDIDTLRSLEEAMGEWEGCAVVVSHDRYFLDRVCTHLLVFHSQGRVQWFEGGYSDYLAFLQHKGKAAVAEGLYVLPGSGEAEEEGLGGQFKNLL